MKLWFVSMECAGIVEAGGVKNVTYSLCKEFSELGHEVSLFIPVFKCNSWEMLTDIQILSEEQKVTLCGREEKIKYTTATCSAGNFNVVLINHPSFAEKEGVYTYTENEQKKNPEFKKGEGHKDMLFKDILFQKSVAAYLNLMPVENVPDIIHCQDASTAVLPALIRKEGLSKNPETVVTIHNAGPYYHHEFKDIDEAVWYTEIDKKILNSALNGTRVEPFLIAADAGAKLTTVSEVYAQELMNPQNDELTDGLSPLFYSKKIEVKGITNGFDYDRYNPENKNISRLPYEFSPVNLELEGKYKARESFIKNIASNPDFSAEGICKIGSLECSENSSKEILFAYHGRVTTQKGLSVLNAAIPKVLNKNKNIRFIIAGQGDPGLEAEITSLTSDYEGKVIFINGYNQAVVRLVTAVSDFMVLPSFFEPCGLEDFTAQAYGTIPVAHKTGGLNKIQNGVTGFLYENNTPEELADKILEVAQLRNNVEVMNSIIKAGAESVRGRYNWKNVIKNEYLKFFKEILKK